MAQSLGRIIDEFSNQPMAAAKIMRQLLESGSDAFFEQALPILRSPRDSQGFQYLLALLLMNDLILDPLVDPALFTFGEASTIARLLLRNEPLLDIKMVRGMMASPDIDSKEEIDRKLGGARGIRLLDLMAAISDGARILPMMTQLLSHPNPYVRSKAALIAGRSNKNYRWVEQRLAESDPRVRANAVESLWDVNSTGSRGVFWGALTDPDNRVVGNAILGLYRLGEPLAVSLAIDLISHIDEKFRVSGLWVMGETGDPRFRGIAARLISDGNAVTRASAFRCAAKLKQAEAKFLENPSVEVRLFPAPRAGSSWIEASAAIWMASNTQSSKRSVGGLKPTQFVLTKGGQLVTEYEVEEVTGTETLSVAFVTPRLIESDEGFQESLEASYAAALSHKRRSDAWLLLKYLPEQEIKPVSKVGASAFSILRLEAKASETENTTIPVEARFYHDASAIQTAAAALGTRMAWPHGIPQTARIATQALSQARGSRHLIVLRDARMGVSREADWTEMFRAARAAKVAIHIIGTGFGANRVLNSWAELPEALESLYATLVHHYQIRYRSPRLESPGSKQDLVVQVYTNDGAGKDTLS